VHTHINSLFGGKPRKIPAIGLPKSYTSTPTAAAGSEHDIIDLNVIDYDSLEQKSPAEIRKLLLSASMPGFFFVKLRGEVKTVLRKT
jgi:hypothetical protein